MKRSEEITVLVYSLVFLFLFANATRISSVVQALDQAYFIESIDTTAETGRSTTMLTRSSLNAIAGPVIATASQACEYPYENDGTHRLNIYERHSFPVLYLLASLKLLFTSQVIYYFCAMFAFPGLLLVIYLRARFIGLPVLAGVLLVLMVAFHPTWSYASFGQFYPDKLFPVLCVIYLFVLHDWIVRDRRRPVALLILGIVAAATSERSIIMLVAGTLGVYALFGKGKRWSRIDLVPLILIAGVTVYGYIYMHFIQHNSDYTYFSSGTRNFVSVIRQNGEPAKAVYKFLFINLLLLLPFGLFAKRWTLIALGSMIPNLIGSIGGAEKLGWTTHYHSYYFPFLIVALVAGASSFFAKRSLRLTFIIVGLAISVIAVYASLDPFPPPTLRFSANQPAQSGLIKTLEIAAGVGTGREIIDRAEFLQRVAAEVPPGSEVSTLEVYMPALYDQGVRLIHCYPLGLGKAEYLIVPYTREGNLTTWHGFVSYLGPQVAAQADSCLQVKINQSYVMIRAFPESQTTGTALLKLSHQRQ